MEQAEDKVLEAIEVMLHPRSVCIIGASSRLQYGGRFLNNLLQTGYKGQVYPINPRYQELMGVRCYPDVTSLPEAPELAAIIVPYENTMSVLEECAAKGVKTGVIITGGFAERGTDDRQGAQVALGDFARRTGMRLCGPNCLGIANVTDNIWPCSAQLPAIRATSSGDLALVSQSGATAFGPFMVRAQDRGFGFSYILSTGNEADLDAIDFIRYCLAKPQVKAIVAYFEAIKDGDKFRRVAEEALFLGKPIVALKIGRHPAGQRAALSHTASMTGSDQVYDVLFKQLGITRVEDWDELLETGSFLAKSPPLKKETLGIVAHSGGVASLLADKCEAIVQIPQPSPDTRKGLDDILKGFGSSANPVDITWHAFNEDFTGILDLLVADDAFGGVVIGSAGSDEQAQRIIGVSQKTDKPLVMLWTGSERATTGLKLLQSNSIPVFYRGENLIRALRALIGYHHTRTRWSMRKAGDDEIAPVMPVPLAIQQKGNLPLHKGLELLLHYGVTPVRGSLAANQKEAGEKADALGYPVVLKVAAPELPHKTDLGLVKMGLSSRSEVQSAFSELQEKLEAHKEEVSTRAILVQEMVSGGAEVILGVKRDPQFGPVLLLGLGGIFTEIMQDFSLRVCPISGSDIEEMLRELKGRRLLEGFRGAANSDISALKETMMRVAQMAMALREHLVELDINPLFVLPEGQGVRAADALVVLD